MSAVGELVRGHREGLGWSQGRLCAVAGVDRGVLSRIEGGKRTGSPATLAKLCKGLGLSAEEATVLHLAAGGIPPGLDGEKLRAALVLVQQASVAEIQAAGALIGAARGVVAGQ